ncbi:MAG: Crp/Fnr family transcriptional regulator [Bacteroidetes bacterium]|nr:Crp/Fnr family transcriptional regulator [Bacteroidota bacterium]
MGRSNSNTSYLNMLSGKNSSQDLENKVSIIFRNSALNQSCTEEQKNLIVENMSCRNYRKGDVIFYEGQPSFLIYFVYSGIVKLWKEGLHQYGQIIRFAKEGDMMGFWGALENTNYTLTATAITDVQLCYIKKDVFLPVVQANSSLNIILHDYIKELKKTEEDLRNMAEMNVREKVAHSLLVLLELFKNKMDDFTFRIVLSRKEIAALSGICVDRVSKQLSDFKKEKIIIISGKNKFIDQNALNNIISAPNYINKPVS